MGIRFILIISFHCSTFNDCWQDQEWKELKALEWLKWDRNSEWYCEEWLGILDFFADMETTGGIACCLHSIMSDTSNDWLSFMKIVICWRLLKIKYTIITIRTTHLAASERSRLCDERTISSLDYYKWRHIKPRHRRKLIPFEMLFSQQLSGNRRKNARCWNYAKINIVPFGFRRFYGT